MIYYSPLRTRFVKLTLIWLLLLYPIISCKKSKSDNRHIKTNVILSEVSRFNHLNYAIRLWADDSYIYTSDSPKDIVSIYNYNGTLQKQIGKKGDAPWENGTIWHFSPDEDPRYYWVHDYPKQLIKRINIETGSLSKSMKVITPENVQYAGDGKFIVPNMDEKTGEVKIYLYDINKNVILKSIDLSKIVGFKNPKIADRLDFVLSGNMCISENKKYSVLYCYNAGYFFKIDNKSLNVSLIKDVRNLDLPKATIQYGAVRLNPKNIIASSATADTSTLYILASKNSNFAKTDIFYIDMYSLKTDKYIGTMPIQKLDDEQRPVYIAINQQKLVVYYENGTVVIYKKPSKQS